MSYEKLVYIQIVIFTDEFLAKFDSIRKGYNLKHCLIALKKKNGDQMFTKGQSLTLKFPLPYIQAFYSSIL